MLYEPDLARLAFDAWLRAVAADGDLGAGHAAMLTAVENRLGTAQVRDVSLLPTPALTPSDGHATPAAWAEVECCATREAKSADAYRRTRRRQTKGLSRDED